ncbi:hypothetical protein [Anaerococcus senegalensis]|uniref:hypothetical protein n=1 Tax=Anaerococcus senegalensis TaxID=1288120 RepID=UPI00030F1697|nr:hypothetical protein [Anaerococcus senegalensis]
MYTIKVVLKEAENGADTFIIGRVLHYEIMEHFRREGFHNIPIGATLRIEDYDEGVWKFELDKIKEWSVE